MAVKAKDIIDSATKDLQDAGNTRWTRADMLLWHNDGQREAVIYRPDASTSVVDHALAAGWLQTIPTTAIRLIEVKANTGGRACTLTKRETLDSIRPNWRNDTAADTIKAWVFDERDGRHFEVWPPATTSASLKVVVSVPPADCAAETDNISLDDQFKGALVSYVLHRAFRRDGSDEANARLADNYYQLFLQQITGRTDAELAMLPNKAANTRKDTSK